MVVWFLNREITCCRRFGWRVYWMRSSRIVRDYQLRGSWGAAGIESAFPSLRRLRSCGRAVDRLPRHPARFRRRSEWFADIGRDFDFTASTSTSGWSTADCGGKRFHRSYSCVRACYNCEATRSPRRGPSSNASGSANHETFQSGSQHPGAPRTAPRLIVTMTSEHRDHFDFSGQEAPSTFTLRTSASF